MLTSDQKRLISGGCWLPESLRAKHMEIVDRMSRAIYCADIELYGEQNPWGEVRDEYRFRAARALQASGINIVLVGSSVKE